MAGTETRKGPKPNERFLGGREEPALAEVMADPIIKRLMASDRVDPRRMDFEMTEARQRLRGRVGR